MAVDHPSRVPSRGEVYLVELDPTRRSEIRKTRPCVIISPDELNHQLRTAIVAPMTTAGHACPFRPVCRLRDKEGRIALDQLRTVDRERLLKPLGTLSQGSLASVFTTLDEMFEFQTGRPR